MQVTRQHLYSNNSLRRRWMMVFLVTNSLLYMIQIALYISLFLSPNSGHSIITGINIIVASINFLLPIALLMTYWILTTCVFAGFPFLSVKAKRRWTGLKQLVVGWSLTRLLWGGMAIWAAQRNWDELFFVDNEWAFSLIIATIFTVLELAPIAATLATNLTELLQHSDPAQAPPDKPASHSLMKNASTLPTGGLAPRAGRSGSFSVPEPYLAAAASVGVVPRGDHIKHIMSHSDSSNTLADLEAGTAPAVPESKAAPAALAHSAVDDFNTLNTSPRTRAATAGATTLNTPLPFSSTSAASSAGSYRPASHSAAGHELGGGAARALPFSSAAASRENSEEGEVQLHVSMDSDDERAEFDAALDGLVQGTAEHGGGIIVRKA